MFGKVGQIHEKVIDCCFHSIALVCNGRKASANFGGKMEKAESRYYKNVVSKTS